MTRLHALTAVRLVSADPERLAAFYCGLGFQSRGSMEFSADELSLLGVVGGGRRISLAIGAQFLDLDGFAKPGRPYPADVRACDLAFQHFAMVTADVAAACRRALDLGASLISRADVVQLPASSGGVIAAKLRDPDCHPIEFLQFPEGPTADPSLPLILCIDHSAISVSDLARSRAWYEALGLVTGSGSLNHGPTQATLDGLDTPIVDVCPMFAAQPAPHLELLGYRSPVGAAGPMASPLDIAATRLVWRADADMLLRDPDGHLHQLER